MPHLSSTKVDQFFHFATLAALWSPQGAVKLLRLTELACGLGDGSFKSFPGVPCSAN
jgi:hypothetical protein